MGFYGEIQADDLYFKQVLRNTPTTVDNTEMYYHKFYGCGWRLIRLQPTKTSIKFFIFLKW